MLPSPSAPRIEGDKGTKGTSKVNPRRAPKSRNGCLRCKEKRLKCDETHPACQQCRKKDIACPGYKKKTLVWSTKHEKALSINSAPMSSSSVALAVNLARDINENEFQSQESPSSTTAGKSSPQDSMATLISDEPIRIPEPPQEVEVTTDSLLAIRQQVNSSTVPEFLLHLPTMLVEYYFSYVCQIFSSFDGTLNPFRSTVGRLWDGSAPIYYAIQSMAAAYLSNHLPRMSSVGVQMQQEAFRAISQDKSLDRILLTVLLAGQTTAWHDPKDLGLVHLRTAKRLNKMRIERQEAGSRSEKRTNEFFEQCILYWDMLAGYVDDDVDDFGFGDLTIEDDGTFLLPPRPSFSSPETENIFPHPWTGVAPKVQKLFAQVGRLIRAHRRNTTQIPSISDLSLELGFEFSLFPDTLSTTMQASSLETQLLAFQPPPITSLVHSGDTNTPIEHYLTLAEAYRCCALLELYRIFPDLLVQRMPHFATTASEFSFLPPSPAQDHETFLLSLSTHTLSLLSTIPSTSGTRCVQPIVLLASACELRFPTPPPNQIVSAPPITIQEIDIAFWRRFAKTRLQEFQLSLPAKPMVNALRVVEEIWRRVDDVGRDGMGRGEEVFWIDICDELGLGTIFG